MRQGGRFPSDARVSRAGARTAARVASVWAVAHTVNTAKACEQLAPRGLDLNQLKADMESPEVLNALALDTQDAKALKVTQTPEYFVNGRGLQRLAFIAVMLLCIPIALTDMGTAGLRVLTPLVLAAALAGFGVAAHQVWVNAFPTGVARCGRGLAGYFEGLPVETLANWVLEAEGDCGKPVRFFGFVTLPQLGLVAFTAITLVSLRLIALSRRAATFALGQRAE